MKLMVHGQQAFGKSVLEALLARGETICAVFCAPDVEGGRPDSLKVFAQDQGLPVSNHKVIRIRPCGSRLDRWKLTCASWPM